VREAHRKALKKIEGRHSVDLQRELAAGRQRSSGGPRRSHSDMARRRFAPLDLLELLDQL
jgi:hypothetical protein